MNGNIIEEKSVDGRDAWGLSEHRSPRSMVALHHASRGGPGRLADRVNGSASPVSLMLWLGASRPFSAMILPFNDFAILLCSEWPNELGKDNEAEQRRGVEVVWVLCPRFRACVNTHPDSRHGRIVDSRLPAHSATARRRWLPGCAGSLPSSRHSPSLFFPNPLVNLPLLLEQTWGSQRRRA